MLLGVTDAFLPILELSERNTETINLKRETCAPRLKFVTTTISQNVYEHSLPVNLTDGLLCASESELPASFKA